MADGRKDFRIDIEKGWFVCFINCFFPKTKKQTPHPAMNIKEDCQSNKLTLIALHKLIGEKAQEQGIDLQGPLSTVCSNAGVNRTQVYERRQQLEEALSEISRANPGRPAQNRESLPGIERSEWEVRENVLLYRLDHPGAVVKHDSGKTSYSDGFIRFILDLHDRWEGAPERFCAQVEVPYQTLRNWRRSDEKLSYKEFSPRPLPLFPAEASKDFCQIVNDYAVWEGSLRDFFKFEVARMRIGPTPIRRVLLIAGMLPLRSKKDPRYRGSTQKCQPGNILVTDGKGVKVVFTDTGEVRVYNWQGIVDQATICHTAVIVNDTECAEGVRAAFEASCNFLGRPPMAIVHDNKPIHDDKKLRESIEKTTIMIPATPQRGENKAAIEGEFGKYEQAVGTIYLDDANENTLKQSAVREIIRAYTAGINHAGRVELNGESRQKVVKDACPDPEKDRKFIKQLHSDHTNKSHYDSLPTREISRKLLDDGFSRFNITGDSKGNIREWLASRFTPDAIRQGLAIFGTEWSKGRLKNNTAHRYLVKLIKSCQEEIDLHMQEELLREFAETERQAWLVELEEEYKIIKEQYIGTSPDKDFALMLSKKAVFGSMFLQRAFWEQKLKQLLRNQQNKFSAVSKHIRRLFEAPWSDRFTLINKLVTWQYQLDRRTA